MRQSQPEEQPEERRNGVERRVRINEIVALTGLSRATIDRVLNDRPGVHPRTRELVSAARAKLEWMPPLALGNGESEPQAARAIVETDIVLRLGRGLTDQLLAAGAKRPGAKIFDMHQKDEREILEVVRSLCHAGNRPLILAAKDDDRLSAELVRARRRGKFVVTMVSDLHHEARDAFVGIDNRMAGQTAAFLIGNLLKPGPAKIGIVLGDHAFRCHEDREIGFRSYLRTAFGDLAVADVAKGEDSPERTFEAVRDLLETHADIAALYNVAGGNRGLAEALEATGKAASTFVVTHEANAITIPLVRRGLIHFLIAQDPALMLEAAMRLTEQPGRESRTEFQMVDFAIYTKFNLPRFALDGP